MQQRLSMFHRALPLAMRALYSCASLLIAMVACEGGEQSGMRPTSDLASAPCSASSARSPQSELVLDEPEEFQCSLIFSSTSVFLEGDSAGVVPDPGEKLVRTPAGYYSSTMRGGVPGQGPNSV